MLTQADSAPRMHILAIHTRGEGSHAFADALDNMDCVHFLRDERMHWQLDELTLFFQGQTPPPRSNGKSDSPSPVDVRCDCISRGTLVRVDRCCGNETAGDMTDFTPDQLKDAVIRMCPLFRNRSMPVLPVLLVRSDLMRWSLSTYGRFDATMLDNPQFSNVHKHAEEVSTPIYYHIPTLLQSAHAGVRIWHTQAKLIKGLQEECGVTPMIQLYELFTDNIPWDLHRSEVVLPCRKRLPYPVTNATVSVRRAHNHDIRSFVANAEEVYAHFALSSEYPRFATVLASEGVDASKLQLLGT